MLKVLTLNLWNDSGPYPERCERIRHWIGMLAPDVIGFQEVVRGDRLDMLADLTPEGFHSAFGRAQPFWYRPTSAFGNAVVSRWPITSTEVTELPRHSSDEQRVAVTASIEAPFGELSFTSTHLNYKLHHGMVREAQVKTLADAAVSSRPRGGFPPIVVGDFNAEPDSSEIRFMRGFHSIEGSSVNFYDAWSVAGDGGPGITWSNRNDYAAIALEPERRIDYIFVGYPVRSPDGYGLGRIERCAVVCDDERDGVWPSDHFGVYAELRTDPLPVPEALRAMFDREREDA